MSIQRTLERVLELSRADACMVIGWEESSANIRWANNTSTTNGMGETRKLYVISVLDKRVGVVTRSYFPDDRLEDIVRESEAACEGKPEAHDYMPLIEGTGLPPDWDDPSEPTSIAVFDTFATDLADLFKRAGGDGIKVFGYAEHRAQTIFLATSTGIRRRFRKPEGELEFTAKSTDFSRSAWVGRNTSGFADIDLNELYARLEQRLEWSKTMLQMPPGRYQVLLEPSAVADMITYKMITATARDADEGRTVFAKPGGGNRIGEKLYPDFVNIYSDPSEPGLEQPPFLLAIGSSSYSSVFDNGLEAGRVDWVKEGVLTSLITPRFWAAKSGSDRAVPFVGNIVFPAEGPGLDEMIASTDRALLVTCFWYIRQVDPQTLLLTGLTRDGVFLVEGGEVKGAVNNFRYNMSPVQMLAQTSEIGRTEHTAAREFGGGGLLTAMPALRVEDFNMSSVSEAT